jgi:hypothetical protein
MSTNNEGGQGGAQQGAQGGAEDKGQQQGAAGTQAAAAAAGQQGAQGAQQGAEGTQQGQGAGDKGAQGTGANDTGGQQQQKADQFWRDAVDPAFKADADRFTDLNSVFKSNRDLRTQASQRIAVPGADASDEDKAKYRKALGIPEDASGYEIKPPEGIELTDADKELIKVMTPIAHEHGIPANAYNGLVSKFLEVSRDLHMQAIDNIKKFGEASEAALKKEWGKDFDPNLQLANRVADRFGADFKKFLNETPIEGSGMLGDHPIIVKTLAQIGREMSESTIGLGVTPEQKADIQTQINDLNKKVPVGSPGYSDKDHQAKLQELYGKLAGNNPIVGAAGRAA